MNKEIINRHTIAELNSLQRMHTLTEQEQRLVFERQMEIFQRIAEWRMENERMGLVPDISDTWTPEQQDKHFYATGLTIKLFYKLITGRKDRMKK